jgi:hypothetical protein
MATTATKPRPRRKKKQPRVYTGAVAQPGYRTGQPTSYPVCCLLTQHCQL